MSGAIPTPEEQNLARNIAERIDGAEYRQKIHHHARKIRVQGLSNIVLDEIMQFNRQKEVAEKQKDERQTEMEW